MTTYVIDASVLLGQFVQETYTPNVLALFEQVRRDTDQLYLPEFGRLECVNVLWKQVRFQGMRQVQAERAMQDLRALPLRLVMVSDLYQNAFQIGLKHQLAVYDSLYIALAYQLGCPLLTVDQKQMKAAQVEGVSIKLITDFVWRSN